jgi:hypothetical protein
VVFVRFRAFWEAIVQQFVQQIEQPISSRLVFALPSLNACFFHIF